MARKLGCRVCGDSNVRATENICNTCKVDDSERRRQKWREENPLQCMVCDTKDVPVGKNICAVCQAKYLVTKKDKVKEISTHEARALMMQYIKAWESKERTMSIFECLYIDACKLVGHERTKRLKKMIVN